MNNNERELKLLLIAFLLPQAQKIVKIIKKQKQMFVKYWVLYSDDLKRKIISIKIWRVFFFTIFAIDYSFKMNKNSLF